MIAHHTSQITHPDHLKMTPLCRHNKDRDLLGARRRRRTTKPKTAIPPKFPKPPHPDPQIHRPVYDAWTLPSSFYADRALRSPGPGQNPPQLSSPDETISRSLSRPEGSTTSTLLTPDLSQSDSEQPLNISPWFIDTVNTLGLDILSHRFSMKPKRSVGLGAMSIYHGLSMLAIGANGDSGVAFLEIMRFMDLKAMTNDTLALEAYCRASPSLSSAVAIFAPKDLPVKEPWKNVMVETYKAELGVLAADPINAFISKETKDKLTNTVTEATINDQALALISCLYFKAKWSNPFNTKTIQKDATFHCFSKKKQHCDLMVKQCKMEYVADATVQMVILPYAKSEEGPTWKAAIILPRGREISSMEDVLVCLNSSPTVLRKFLLGTGEQNANRRKAKIRLSLPRFSLKNNLDLIPALSKLGLERIFNETNDFSAMFDNEKLAIDHVMHHLFLEVNEEGGEGPAATPTGMT